MSAKIGRGQVGKKLANRSGEITSGSTIASAGRLQPEEAEHFIRQGVDQAGPLRRFGLHIMNSDKKNLETFALGSRLLRKPGEVTGAGNTGITPSKRQLSVEEVVLTYSPSYDFFEDNIERDGGEQTLVDEFAVAFHNDLCDLSINGDSSSGFLGCNDGLLKLVKAASSTGKADVTAAEYAAKDWDTVIFPKILAQLPAKHRANKDRFTLLVSADDADSYLAQLRARGTPLGDDVLVNGKLPRWNGIEVLVHPYMPSASFLLARMANFAYGIRRDVFVESDPQPKLRLVEVTISARVDFEFAIEDEVVVGYDITP